LDLSGLAYLEYYQTAKINWNRLITVSEGTITTLSNAIMIQIPGKSNNGSADGHTATASSLSMTSFGIPLT
jgi:hypothetical protein